MFGIQFERLFVRLARLVELPFVLVRDGEIVEGRGVGRVELGRLFPAVDRLAPEPALRDADAEFDLGLGLAPRVGERRRRRQSRDERDKNREPAFSSVNQAHYTVLDRASKRHAIAGPEKLPIFVRFGVGTVYEMRCDYVLELSQLDACRASL